LTFFRNFNEPIIASDVEDDYQNSNTYVDKSTQMDKYLQTF